MRTIRKQWVLYLLVLLFFGWMFGCADSSTSSKREYKELLVVSTEAGGFTFVQMDVVLDAASEYENTAEAKQDISPRTDANVGLNGSSATKSGADLVADGITSAFTAWQEIKQDALEKEKESEATEQEPNDVGASDLGVPIDDEVADEVAANLPVGEKVVKDDVLYVRQTVSNYITLDQMATVSPAYVFPEIGPEYGCSGSMRFDWVNGDSMIVPNPDEMYIADAELGLKYQPGTWAEAEAKTMEVYCRKQPESDNGDLSKAPAYVIMSCSM